jgi:hypothetical protein
MAGATLDGGSSSPTSAYIKEAASKDAAIVIPSANIFFM